jgi:hypothetical protein
MNTLIAPHQWRLPFQRTWREPHSITEDKTLVPTIASDILVRAEIGADPHRNEFVSNKDGSERPFDGQRKP